MKVDIPYGKEKIEVNIPKPCEILVPNKVKNVDENKVIKKALKEPIGMESFEEFAEK